MDKELNELKKELREKLRLDFILPEDLPDTWLNIKAKTNYCIDCKHKHIGNMNSLKQVKEGTRLFDKRPDLVKEWDYEKNYPLTPKEVSFGSDKKVWWKCPLSHSWRASISKRTNGTGCPYCYSEYGTSFPEQAILYYLSKVT